MRIDGAAAAREMGADVARDSVGHRAHDDLQARGSRIDGAARAQPLQRIAIDAAAIGELEPQARRARRYFAQVRRASQSAP